MSSAFVRIDPKEYQADFEEQFVEEYLWSYHFEKCIRSFARINPGPDNFNGLSCGMRSNALVRARMAPGPVWGDIPQHFHDWVENRDRAANKTSNSKVDN